jgi:hypothetical protein
VKYTKDILLKAVSNSVSVAEVLRKLGIKETGGSHAHISRRIKLFGIDTSHMLGQRHNLRKPNLPKLHWSKILIKRTSGRRGHAHILRRALIEYGKEYKCIKCSNRGEWLGQKLVLQVHHTNSDWLDDRPENLEFVCPNCHSIIRPSEGN